jgi:hypothetical protein
VGCTKQRYRTRIDALLVMGKTQWKDNPKREKVERRAYRCPNCKGWHLTSRA